MSSALPRQDVRRWCKLWATSFVPSPLDWHLADLILMNVRIGRVQLMALPEAPAYREVRTLVGPTRM
jgi:hypothetical protein